MIRKFIYKIAECFDNGDVAFKIYPETKYRSCSLEMVREGSYDPDFCLRGEWHSVYTLDTSHPVVKLLFTKDPELRKSEEASSYPFDLIINGRVVLFDRKEFNVIEKAIVSHEKLMKELELMSKESEEKKRQQELKDDISKIEEWRWE